MLVSANHTLATRNALSSGTRAPLKYSLASSSRREFPESVTAARHSPGASHGSVSPTEKIASWARGRWHRNKNRRYFGEKWW